MPRPAISLATILFMIAEAVARRGLPEPVDLFFRSGSSSKRLCLDLEFASYAELKRWMGFFRFGAEDLVSEHPYERGGVAGTACRASLLSGWHGVHVGLDAWEPLAAEQAEQAAPSHPEAADQPPS